jgi:hypothetical protein
LRARRAVTRRGLLHPVLRLLLRAAVLLLRRLAVLGLLLRRLAVLGLLLLRGAVLLLRRLAVLGLLLRRLAVLGLLLRGLAVARLRLTVPRRRLPVLRLSRLLRRTGHQLRALERLLSLLRLTLLGLTLLGKRSGLTGILRSTRRVAGGLIHRDLLFPPPRVTETRRERT